MTKINYETEIQNLKLNIAAIKSDIEQDWTGKRIDKLKGEIAKIQETIDLLELTKLRLPNSLAAAERKLKALEAEYKLQSNRELKELIKLRDQLNKKIAKARK